MTAAIWAYAGILDQHRQILIARWSEHSGEAAVDAYIAELQNDPYTLLLRTIADRISDEEFLTVLASKLITTRDGMPEGRFLELAEVVTALEGAFDILNDPPVAASAQNIAMNEDTDLIAIAI